jgi:prolyl oligopeptidase
MGSAGLLPLPGGAKLSILPASIFPRGSEHMRRLFWLLFPILASGAFAVTLDPYAWLEDVHGEKPLAWVAEQNAKSLGVLKRDPRYRPAYESILSVMDAPDRIPYGTLRAGRVYNFWQDAANPKGLWRRTGGASYRSARPDWEILLDIDALAKTDKEDWVFKGAGVSPDQRRALISLSRGGGDAVVVREFDIAARAFVPDGFALAEAKSDVAWWGTDRVLFDTDFGEGSLTTSGYPRIVKLWRRGTPPAEAETVFEGKVSDVGVSPVTFDTTQGSFALIARAVSFFETELYLVKDDGGTLRLPLPLGTDLKGMTGGTLIFTLRDAWTAPGGKTFPKGALAGFALADFARGKPAAAALLYGPGPRSSIESVSPGFDAVYAAITDNVVSKVHVFRAGESGWTDKLLDLPPGGSADIVSSDDDAPGALLSFENYLTPPTLYADDGGDRPEAIKSLPARFDASGMVSQQFEATSKDGTEIPYFVTRPKNLAGPAPTILYGYGGFEVSLTPSYSANFGRQWLTRGGIYVVANIRGGGEFGPAWHEAALKTHRQRAYDDFEAVAEDLEKRGLTTPRQLGIMGGSNGGLLVSTVMVQRPALFGAVVCQVPLIDMIAYTHIGAGASWIGEYGDPADPKMRDYILTYSPYQNVKAGVTYPPVFFVTATSDDRVTPVHARKMAAKMEALGQDVLFFENTDGGHAAAADHKQAAEMWALSFVYLAERLGL